MDDILSKIVTESQSQTLADIVTKGHQVIEIICDKSSLMRNPINEVRHKCLLVFHSCLLHSNNNSKLIQLSINGMQAMVRNEMYWTVDTNEDEQQLPSQLISCISSTIECQKECTQLEMMSVLREMSCRIPSLISVDNIEDIIEMCCKLTVHSPDHRMAIESTASQSCHQFIKYCISNESSDCVDEEVIPLFSILTTKLKLLDQTNNSDSHGIGVLFKCIHYFFITIPNDSNIVNDVIIDNIWRILIPLMIKNLNHNELNQIYCKSNEIASQSTDGKGMGRGSESLNTLAKSSCYKEYIFKIASQLLRIFGRMSSLRPALESLFHRILLFPPVGQRLDALQWVQELLKDPSLIVRASVDDMGQSSRSKDLDLLHIIMDSIEESSLSSDARIYSLSISSMVTFLQSLQSICNSNLLNTQMAQHINKLFPTFQDSDFEGFDVRTLKLEPKLDFEKQSRVSFEILKTRIIGFDSKDNITITDTCSGTSAVEQHSVAIPHSIDQNLSINNFKVEVFKSKLREILDSKSTDTDSQDIDNESIDSHKSNGCPNVFQHNNENNDINESGQQMSANNSSLKDSNTSCTEGPELEDIASGDQVFDKQQVHQMSYSDDGVHRERLNARRYINALKLFLPKLMTFRSSVEADHALQVFASHYCSDLFEQQKLSLNTNQSNDSPLTQITIINADAIYLSTYSTLLLNLKLIHSNYYSNIDLTVPLTEQEFIEDIQSTGILVYISCHWLAELYQRVLSDNLLASAGYNHEEQTNVALINILSDIDGLDSCQPGAQQLSDYRRLEKAVLCQPIAEREDEMKATYKLVRRLLTAFWNTILGSLGTVFRFDYNTNESNNSKMIDSHKQTITNSLNGLQIAAKLCIILGLQSRCDTVFELLALSVIESKSNHKFSKTNNKKSKQIGRTVIQVIKNRLPFSLHTSHVLTLQVLLSSSLEIGPHCSPCWRYVFKCCQYIMELEHNYFTSRHSSLLTSTRTSLSSLIKSSKQSDIYMNFVPNSDSTFTSMPGINESEEINTETLIHNLITETTSQSNDSILKDKQLERVIEILSHLVDLLFEDAANKLNLRSLDNFLTELCHCSREQLSLLRETDVNSYSGKSLLLFRLSDVILRCAKSGRPIIHFIKCWSVVAQHLVEASTHSDHFVAKKSISTLHDIINVILSVHNELPHFHFNESLFKPFENLLLLELCDSDIQELIISSICEFVEGTTDDIRSGWRSLFGALHGIRLPQVCPQSPNAAELQVERVRQLRVILDIFEAFLHTDNLQVFANAAVDCLLCLLKLIKNRQLFENDCDFETLEDNQTPDLCLIALKYLHQFSSMLRSMYTMPACPVFSFNRRLHTSADTKVIDISHLPNMEPLTVSVTLDTLDRPVRILHVWFLLVDELTQAIDKCPQKHMKTAIEMLFNWFHCFIETPGPNFAIYCINHILLPSLQRMIRQSLEDTHNTDDNPMPNTLSHKHLSTLRHLFGLTADLIVNNIKILNTDSNGHDLSESTINGIDLMLKQSILVYIECLDGNCHESIAKLSCACIRHILLSVWTHFDDNLWQTTIDCLSIAHKTTLQSLHSLVHVFSNKNQQFFDDFEQIQVISKRNASEDSEHLCRLAQQIFLLDAQRSSADIWDKSRTSDPNRSLGENRSFVFVINNADNYPMTVSFRVLVIQLTSHWLILQTISSLILIGIKPLLPHIDKFAHFSATTMSSKSTVLSMNLKQCQTLLSLMDDSFRISFNFDSKPGLKFLIQKMSRSDIPSNLYQISSLVWSVRFNVYLFLTTDESHPNDNFSVELKQSLSDLCHKYKQHFKSNHQNQLTVDDISHQSLYFLQNSNQELMDIIANHKSNKTLNTFSVTAEENVKQIQENNQINNCEESDENDIKLYNLATEQKMDSYMAEYKKYKTQHSPIPPSVGDNISDTNDRQAVDALKHTQTNSIIKDTQAFTALWSDVIAYAIDLHLSLPLKAFNQLIPAFLPSIQTLVVFCDNKHLRSRISLWITRIAENSIERNH